MVPKVAQAGQSFKGAARYYLHDKQANTSDRVGFVETINLPTNDAQRAVAHMIDTAAHANQLKKAAGFKESHKQAKPVYVYSLSWSPDENPTQEEQLEAARESLEALGFTDRQVLIVSHTDQKHPHVHVIVNKVCPETGISARTSHDQIKLSEWAEAYEKRHGRVLCPERVKNNEARRRGEWRKDDQSLGRRDHREWKKAQSQELWDDFRATKSDMAAPRKAQFDALYRQKEERFALRKDEVKALYKPIWRDVFTRQKAELKDFDAGLHKRVKFALSQSRGKALGLLQAVFAQNDLRHQFVQQQEAERAQIAARQGQTIRDAGREVTKAWKYDRDALRAAHKAEDDSLYQETKNQSKAIWTQEWGQDWQQDFSISATFQTQQDHTPAPEPKPDKVQEVKGEKFGATEQEPQKKPRADARGILKKSRERSQGRSRNRTRKPPR